MSWKRALAYAVLAVVLAELLYLGYAGLTRGSLAVEVAAAGGTDRSYAGTRPAPAWPDGVDWINVSEPLTWEDLRGKVVVLDFWTYGCINCLHIIPDLKRLEEKYGDELVVIGVHSAKFDNEGRTDRIREFVRRHELEHPVVNDKDFRIWRNYGARAWPTLVVVDPAGKAAGKLEGEGHYETLDEVIGSLLAEFRARGEVDGTRLAKLDLITRDDALADTDLAYPAKLAITPDGDGLVIADTSHHRLVVAGLDGTVRQVIGGERGFSDGDLDTARFHMPRGLAFEPDGRLYVADTGNHAIRVVDLDAGSVHTVVGNGEQEYQSDDHAGPGEGLKSPWALLWHDDRLFIAMAGQHQVWIADVAAGTAEAYAGSRREALTDGPRRSAGMNQPSGLTTDGEVVYVADSEASAIRRITPGEDGRLETLVGTGLFDFGDRDGVGDHVLLQHALGVAWHDGFVYIADTYNSKLKRLDPATRQVETLVHDGLDEPGGLVAHDGRLYIADTNAHRVRVFDIASGELRTLDLTDPGGLL